MHEADIIINGVKLDDAQSMTLRVAIASLLAETRKPGALGNDDIGTGISRGYCDRCSEILKTISGLEDDRFLVRKSSSDPDKNVFDVITEKWMPLEEKVARTIARKLGHNDDTGMHWERYTLAARGIIDEAYIVIPGIYI